MTLEELQEKLADINQLVASLQTAIAFEKYYADDIQSNQLSIGCWKDGLVVKESYNYPVISIDFDSLTMQISYQEKQQWKRQRSKSQHKKP